MTDAQKRQYVSDLYHGAKWKKRVEKMRDDEITAIYLKHIQEGTMPVHQETEEEQEHLDIPPRTSPENEEEQEHLDIPSRPPHENEDQFPIY